MKRLDRLKLRINLAILCGVASIGSLAWYVFTAPSLSSIGEGLNDRGRSVDNAANNVSLEPSRASGKNSEGQETTSSAFPEKSVFLGTARERGLKAAFADLHNSDGPLRVPAHVFGVALASGSPELIPEVIAHLGTEAERGSFIAQVIPIAFEKNLDSTIAAVLQLTGIERERGLSYSIAELSKRQLFDKAFELLRLLNSVPTTERRAAIASIGRAAALDPFSALRFGERFTTVVDRKMYLSAVCNTYVNRGDDIALREILPSLDDEESRRAAISIIGSGLSKRNDDSGIHDFRRSLNEGEAEYFNEQLAAIEALRSNARPKSIKEMARTKAE